MSGPRSSSQPNGWEARKGQYPLPWLSFLLSTTRVPRWWTDLERAWPLLEAVNPRPPCPQNHSSSSGGLGPLGDSGGLCPPHPPGLGSDSPRGSPAIHGHEAVVGGFPGDLSSGWRPSPALPTVREPGTRRPSPRGPGAGAEVQRPRGVCTKKRPCSDEGGRSQEPLGTGLECNATGPRMPAHLGHRALQP